MSIGLVVLLFLVSVILCGVSGAAVKRSRVQINRVALVVFHLVYISGLVASYLLL